MSERHTDVATPAESLGPLLDSIDLMYETGWTDGLPVVPPTRERVKQFTDVLSPRNPGELIAEIPPLGGNATIERVAVNAVMAGCLPEYKIGRASWRERV